MTLDPSYLDYPKRRHGMDHDYYPWSDLRARAPIAWPGGKKVAVWIVADLEWFPITPADKPFRAPGHMQTSYPDYRHYTAREYGTRVGFYRMLDAFAKVGATVSVAANGAIAERYPSILRDIVAAGHEVIAHSTDMNGTIASGLDEDTERALIAGSLDALEKATGGRPRGWLSIARSQSFNTPHLLAEAGLDYMCDWVNDELPYRFHTAAGDIVNLPLSHELSDRQIIVNQQHGVDSYVEQMLDAYDLLAGEAETYGGRMLPLNVTPYILGLPYRIDAFERLLAELAARPGVWFARGDQIVDAAGI
ncbi:polysaccharide deacetylase family protein [Sphingomonas sp. HITSZ_GF]|uniref:polysaccharide deacetylase family protein n=1 Tax=Sphingomonas sp. HITSZ_GF TaxID=3037247 RepID=UPI00240D5B0D|nr:polysaccharide deacetylase family protein [Sphingomonas sp. HITSZ_GF]MDG2532163.1 polysaccharide deacetylase family protein [Sphingomonas sp. HITSZ_GF]